MLSLVMEGTHIAVKYNTMPTNDVLSTAADQIWLISVNTTTTDGHFTEAVYSINENTVMEQLLL